MTIGHQEQDRRQFSRIDFDAEVSIEQAGRAFAAQLEDISLNGVLLSTSTPHRISMEAPCLVKIQLADKVMIHMQAALVHSGANLLGFHCTSIDMDSVIHLRRLIEMNLTDPHACERVLSELARRRQP